MKILKTKISSTLAVLSFCLVPGSAAKAATAEDCANLAKLVAANTTITSASLIPVGGACLNTAGSRAASIPKSALKSGFPTTWNQKLYFPRLRGNHRGAWPWSRARLCGGIY